VASPGNAAGKPAESTSADAQGHRRPDRGAGRASNRIVARHGPRRPRRGEREQRAAPACSARKSRLLANRRRTWAKRHVPPRSRARHRRHPPADARTPPAAHRALPPPDLGMPASRRTRSSAGSVLPVPMAAMTDGFSGLLNPRPDNGTGDPGHPAQAVRRSSRRRAATPLEILVARHRTPDGSQPRRPRCGIAISGGREQGLHQAALQRPAGQKAF